MNNTQETPDFMELLNRSLNGDPEMQFTPDQLQEMDDLVIDPNHHYHTAEVLLAFGEKTLLTRGNISGIIGLPSSRKSFLCTLLVSAYMSAGECDNSHRFSAPAGAGKVLWIDTEQDREQAAECGRRVFRNSPVKEDDLTMLGLCELSIDDRLRITLAAIQRFRPDLVVVDGIADLVGSPNDEQASIEVIDLLMNYARAYNCHILTIIHANYNSGGRPRGHLGSTLARKASIMLILNADERRTRVAYLKSRYELPPKFAFTISCAGLPLLDDGPAVEESKPRKNMHEILEELFNAILLPNQYLRSGELVELIQKHKNNTITASTARNFISDAAKENIIIKSGKLYRLTPKQSNVALTLDM